jgi:hypothetical protein
MAIHPSRPSIEPKAVGTPKTIGSPGLSWALAVKGKVMKMAKTNNIKPENISLFITSSSFKNNLEQAAPILRNLGLLSMFTLSVLEQMT